ncbi:MAG: hypothetical protein IJM23_05690 [Lachnospiraceae bacterium]|nr:hypothetical protein [Lachnospiraceae bacterium]
MFWKNTKKMKKLLKKHVDKEYSLFKKSVLKAGKKDIYNACDKIKFWENVYEYFQYNTAKLDKNTLCATSGLESLIAELWNLYLNYEPLKVNTWEDIDELVQTFVNLQLRKTIKKDT